MASVAAEQVVSVAAAAAAQLFLLLLKQIHPVVIPNNKQLLSLEHAQTQFLLQILGTLCCSTLA